VRFYASCCAPCDRNERTCPICGADLWIGKRPKHVAFVRSVKAWLRDVLRVPALRNAINKFRERHGQPGVISDIFDGALVAELIHLGAFKLLKTVQPCSSLSK
jgi:hypothetical protein